MSVAPDFEVKASINFDTVPGGLFDVATVDDSTFASRVVEASFEVSFELLTAEVAETRAVDAGAISCFNSLAWVTIEAVLGSLLFFAVTNADAALRGPLSLGWWAKPLWLTSPDELVVLPDSGSEVGSNFMKIFGL